MKTPFRLAIFAVLLWLPCGPLVRSERPAPTDAPWSSSRLDVNGDGQVTPADAILIIEHLNERAAGQGLRDKGVEA